MMNAFIFALTANGRTFLENAQEAGKVTLLGMGTIFIVLALLWGVIEIMHTVMAAGEKKKKKEFQTQDELSGTAAIGTKSAATVADEAPADSAADDGALIAVITAAVSAAMAEEGYTGGFRVVSFKRASAGRNGRV